MLAWLGFNCDLVNACRNLPILNGSENAKKSKRDGAPGRARTVNKLIKSQLLYH